MRRKKTIPKMIITLIITAALIAGILPTAFAESVIETAPSPAPTVTDPAPSAEPDPSATPAPSVGEAAEPSATPEVGAAVEPSAAPAPTAENNTAEVQAKAMEEEIDKHAKKGITPAGTTIDLFDYWLTGRDKADNIDPDGGAEMGINAGRQLKFGATDYKYNHNAIRGSKLFNRWTESKAVRSGMLKNTLENGYPALKKNSQLGITADESLDYLFNSSEFDGKVAFSNVDGLLQVDTKGYYYYNSQNKDGEIGQNFDTANFASYDKETNTFKLYETWAVNFTGGDKNKKGQFFPFNKGSEVFELKDGKLTQNSIGPKDATLNHYFGMAMTTQFIQRYGGHTAQEGDPKSEKVTYQFSGDDDVWIFIDDVLVGDLGGIHDAAKLDIDFSTGEVNINGGKDQAHGSSTTIRDCFEAAGKDENVSWSGNTFADDTYHTLKFFYLERGHSDSNMSLKFNLEYIPQSDIVKVDQDGNGVPNATFELYAADTGYNIKDENSPICTATTDSNGRVTLKDPEGKILTVAGLKERSDGYIVMKEKYPPPGYRNNNADIHLRFDGTDKNPVLLSDNLWKTGTYASAKVATTLPNDPITVGGDKLNRDEIQNGTLFAVVFKRDDADIGKPIGESSWYPVSGDPTDIDGWKVAKDRSWSSVLAAAQENPYIFKPSQAGSYIVEIENMPGDILTYNYMLAENERDAKAKFTVAYYYSSAQTIAGATEENTQRLASDDYDRQFATRLYVNNIVNRLLVQKLDQNGNPVHAVSEDAPTSAEFKLYSEDQVKIDSATGTVTVMETEKDKPAGGTVHTRDMDKKNHDPITMDAAGYFDKLEEGTYYLFETKPPEGYEASTDVVEVIVSDGVYANAGTTNDSVSVRRGIGSIVKSMVQFAADDDVDATLHDIKAVKQDGEQQQDGTFKWTTLTKTDANTELHLSYSAEDAPLEYGSSTTEFPNTAVTADTGWFRLDMTQCLNHDDGIESTKQILDEGQSLRNLFSGTCTVQMRNQKIEDLSITKQVTGAYGDLTRDFKFTVKITDENDNPVKVASDKEFNYTISKEGANPDTGTATIDNDGMMQFDSQDHLTLKHDETIVISGLHENWKAVIKETFDSENNDGYEVSWTTQGGSTSENNKLSFTETIDNDGNAVTCTNTRTAIPETDATITTPGGMALLIAGLIAGLALMGLGYWRYKRTQS